LAGSESNIAKCYIQYDKDEKNKCEFSDRRLNIVYRGRRSEFPIENLVSLGVNHRKLLIPIILSGILTPLISVGFFKGLFHPFVALIFIIGGVFTFYIGWLGEKVLTVNLINSYHDFSVKLVSYNLNEFINFVNQYLQKEPIDKRVLYMEFIKDKDHLDIKKYLSKDTKDRKLFSFWNLKDMYAEGKVLPNASYIVIDPLKAGTQVKYSQDNDDQILIPRIKGDINSESVLRIIDFDEIRNLFQ
jgi:hypothetical protein